jgi:predicted Fe-S protein YdhL (DUF1289 family)
MTEIESPCVDICSLDPLTDLCMGCARSVAEITAWRSMSPGDRTAVMQQLPDRLDRMIAAARLQNAADMQLSKGLTAARRSPADE